MISEFTNILFLGLDGFHMEVCLGSYLETSGIF